MYVAVVGLCDMINIVHANWLQPCYQGEQCTGWTLPCDRERRLGMRHSSRGSAHDECIALICLYTLIGTRARRRPLPSTPRSGRMILASPRSRKTSPRWRNTAQSSAWLPTLRLVYTTLSLVPEWKQYGGCWNINVLSKYPTVEAFMLQTPVFVWTFMRDKGFYSRVRYSFLGSVSGGDVSLHICLCMLSSFLFSGITTHDM